MSYGAPMRCLRRGRSCVDDVRQPGADRTGAPDCRSHADCASLRCCAVLAAAAPPAAAFRAPGSRRSSRRPCATTSRSASQAQGAVHRELLRLSRRAEDSGARRRTGSSASACKNADLLRRLPRAVGRGAGASSGCTSPTSSRATSTSGTASRSQRSGARLHPREVLHRDQSEPQAEPAARPSAGSPAPSTRRGARRASSSATSARRSSTTRATSCSPTSCRGASSCATTSARSQKVRDLAVRIQQADPKFKPLRDAIHNQLSAGLIPQLAAYRDKLPPGAVRDQVDELIAEISKLTSLDEQRARARRSPTIEDAGAARRSCTALLPARERRPGRRDRRRSAQLMVLARADASRRARFRRPTRAG